MENQLQSGQPPQYSQEFIKKRRFYLVVPILVLPFLTMAFWALDGGKDGSSAAAATPKKGIELALPSAQFRNREAIDKMDIYQSAKKDSLHTAEGVSKDFMHAMGFKPERPVDSSKINLGHPQSLSNPADQQSAKIEAKLAQINRQINQPQLATYRQSDASPEVQRLNKMMRAMKNGSTEDPEMKQLNEMLTKIQAIQNPQSVKLKPEQKTSDSAFRAIPAIIDGKQKVMNGGTVRLKLTDSVSINGIKLPKGQLLYGACQVTNQRLLLNIQNIRIGKDILPTNLTVFSLDGMPGIPAPEAELSGAAGDGASNAVQSMQFLSMDGNLSAQAAAGGINAAKGLLSKKVHKVKVKLKDEFPVLLKINKN
ncbi:conjugative transposon protein TraM [Mucilaginibacter sabulilitoris]|uniref:Conjugative transposon protein TraM n=1 Tax=Mucilaginibacter sabulilitoris TaxID=1173583 RepID=A0ABZ0TUK0_9SPHI|nr:conjugative transposon protein TraM [Mucilaginibacter sabulilitoris]WPU94810.1 conjugative transposon protein TraM [Mucilaginibacter sabulilitoris]